jgi:hypothetical protein
MGDGSFVLPGGTEFTFSDVTRSSGGTKLSYSPSTPTSTVISIATISRDDTTIGVKGSSATYSAKGQARNPSIIFPSEAEPLLKDPDAVLKITEVRRMVRYEIPLSGRE